MRKVANYFFILVFILIFTSCSYHKIPINLSGTNDFYSLISKLVDKSAKKIKKNISLEQSVIVTDFVSLDKLKNKSQLGFLLSDLLKDKLSSLNVLIREVEFRKDFELGKRGLNALTREKNEILKKYINKASYTVVGTYSITSKSLNVFIKLLDNNSGNIISSSYERTPIDDEILQLDKEEPKVILKPTLVL